MTGQLIRQVRRQLGLSREDFAARFYVSTEQLGRYERGQQKVPLDIAREMAALDPRIAEARCAECPLCGIVAGKRGCPEAA